MLLGSELLIRCFMFFSLQILVYKSRDKWQERTPLFLRLCQATGSRAIFIYYETMMISS